VSMQLPATVDMTVTETEPGLRGDSASGGTTKSATLETGLQVRVPLFIKQGEVVRINTETGQFVSRAKEGMESDEKNQVGIDRMRRHLAQTCGSGVARDAGV